MRWVVVLVGWVVAGWEMRRGGAGAVVGCGEEKVGGKRGGCGVVGSGNSFPEAEPVQTAFSSTSVWAGFQS